MLLKTNKMEKIAYLLANFGGPRNLLEIKEFLIELLTDQEVIRTSFPAFLHRLIFTRVAKKRALEVTPDYVHIGGKSPIYEDTEEIAALVGKKLGAEVLTFHRYLSDIHANFLQKIQAIPRDHQIRVLPLFPQFSYATTGSIALWFSKHLPDEIIKKMQWVSSYASHDSYLTAMEHCIREFLDDREIPEERSLLLFSAHGLPQNFIDTGDIYQSECEHSFNLLNKRFPHARSILSYQSQFGKEAWIRPYTVDICNQIEQWMQGRSHVVVIPLSFTSDHIETLYEIEELYIRTIRTKGISAFRCPALNRREDWITTIVELFQNSQNWQPNHFLLRRSLGSTLQGKKLLS